MKAPARFDRRTLLRGAAAALASGPAWSQAAAFPKHRHCVADRFNFIGVGYNTHLVKQDVPKSYLDLGHLRSAGRVNATACRPASL